MSQMKETLKKNTMVIALIVVAVFFTFMTDGALLLSSNITNLIAQNGYVVILAVGMLLCILTGGNIGWFHRMFSWCRCRKTDGKWRRKYVGGNRSRFVSWSFDWYLAGILDCLCPHPTVYRNSCRYAFVAWSCVNRS